MPGIYDALETLFGRGNPVAQLAAGTGQGPNQPGSPVGPQPLVQGGAPPPPPSGAPPAGAGGPQGPAPAPPQPQAYQSPPDMMQMYGQLMQHQQGESMFNRGMANLVAGFSPLSQRASIASQFDQGPDAGSTMGNILKLQQWSQQQQQWNQQLGRYNDLLTNSDKYAKSFGVDPDMFRATIQAAGPQGAGDILGKIAEAQMGITGTQTDKEYKQAIRNFQAANPGAPLPPELQTEAGFAAQQVGAVTTAKTKADDLQADQHNFPTVLGNYDKTIGLIDQFNQPDMQEAAKEFLGPGGQLRGDTGALSPAGRKAWALYGQIMATQFAAGTQDFKGAGRITQSELTQDAPSQSTMGKLNQDPSKLFQGVAKYREQLAQHRANAFGAAQKADDPRLSDEDYAKYVAPNIDVLGGPKRNLPDFSKMSEADADAAVAKLSSGAVFIGTDGQPHRKS